MEQLVRDLRTLGIDVWWSGEQLSPTGLWLPEVSDRLETAEFFVPVFTPEFFASTYCWREVQAAVQLERERGRLGFLLPVLLRFVHVPCLLAVPPPIDFRDPTEYARSLVTLASAIEPNLDLEPIDLQLNPESKGFEKVIVPAEARKAWNELNRNSRMFTFPVGYIGSHLACPRCAIKLEPARILVEQSGDGGAIYEPEPGLRCARCGCGYFQQGQTMWWRPRHYVLESTDERTKRRYGR